MFQNERSKFLHPTARHRVGLVTSGNISTIVHAMTKNKRERLRIAAIPYFSKRAPNSHLAIALLDTAAARARSVSVSNRSACRVPTRPYPRFTKPVLCQLSYGGSQAILYAPRPTPANGPCPRRRRRDPRPSLRRHRAQRAHQAAIPVALIFAAIAQQVAEVDVRQLIVAMLRRQPAARHPPAASTAPAHAAGPL